MVDVFSKFMAVVAIKSKDPPDVLAGIMGRDTENGWKTAEVLFRRRR